VRSAPHHLVGRSSRFVLRRIKANVLGQLPDKVEKVLRCDLTAWQATLYEQIRSAGVHAVSEEADSKSSRKRRNAGDEAPDAKPRGLNNVLMQLRKVVNHPYLFRTDQWVADEAFIRASGKFVLLDSMLPKLKAAGHRVLLFSQMTSLIDLLEDFFHLRGFDYLRLDGSTPAEEREKRMAMFNDASSPAFVFLLSTRAGGLGLNLATADTVIIFDSDWNPMMDAQAQDRAHRIGQRHEVRVYRLISASPVEERILARATEKLNVQRPRLALPSRRRTVEPSNMGMVVAAAGIRGQRPEERRWQRHRRRDGTVYCGGGISVRRGRRASARLTHV